MVEKRSTKFMGLKNKKLKLLIVIIILLSSLITVASLSDTPPIANCEPDKLNCQNVNTPVQFNASASYDQNGFILSYEWDFGDGTTGTGVAPNHTYTSYRWNGSAYLPFIVHLKITNNLGVTNITSQQVTIWIAGDANGDGVVNILDASVVGLKWNSNDECADLNNDGSVNILDASIIGLNWARKTSDNTPPAGITHLINAGFAENYINWTWTDPADTDFTNVSVWIDGEFKTILPKGIQLYEAMGFAADSEHTISTRTIDTSGNLNQTWINHTARTAVTIELPPDPSTVAPLVDNTVATTIATSTSFLYTGSNPIQTGVANGTIEATRAAVLRGRVLTRDGTNLSGVNITILSHPEFGSTLTRADGMFDMAVNGGGLLTVNYEKTGYLTVQRQVNAPWQDYAWLPDIVMIQADPAVTNIDLSSTEPIQVSQGSIINDSDGTRQATLLFPQGIQANITLPDGTTQPLTNMHVRATEYTVGENGPEAMPGELPPNIGYTYAVELSVDEAPFKLNGKDVIFNKPVFFYVENFLNFSVGIPVPLGYYDRDRGAWVPSDSGIIIKILSITNGMADLDINGSDQAANTSTLEALNITDAERQQLATLYQPGQSLWRMTLNHLSTWDANWGTRCKDDKCDFPNRPDPDKPHEDCEDKQTGSIIGCQNQVLGEVVGVAGTPFNLHYQSDRVPGRIESNTLDISLSGMNVAPYVNNIILEVSVAGQHFEQKFTAIPNMINNFIWDGKDAYGRTMQGKQPVTVKIGYVYEMEYVRTNRFGYNGGGSISANRARQDFVLWQKWEGEIGPWDARNQGLGGWSLNVHHAYDPINKVFYNGDGSQRSAKAQGQGQIITTVAGNGNRGFGGDGGPATKAQFNTPTGVAMGADGSLYIADYWNDRVRRVGPDGNITTVAGNGGGGGYGGDGGLATQAQLYRPYGVAIGPDGSLYIVDSQNARIRRVGPDGIITTVAGIGGSGGYSGDGGPATQAQLSPRGIAIGPDGSLYIADGSNNRVRRVGPDGIITTEAGNGMPANANPNWLMDGLPATQARLTAPNGVAIGADGILYIADMANNRVRRVGTDGIITTWAGSGSYPGFSGDGDVAWHATLNSPFGVAIQTDGSFYIADADNRRVRHVGTDGNITTVAGNGIDIFGGDGGPATQAQLSTGGIAIGLDGSFYIADKGNNRIRRVSPALPGFSLTDFFIPSEDGSEVFIFNSAGRHLRTLDALTGAVRYNFTYDGKGKLSAITDRDDNSITIERDATGFVTSIVSPYGQRTDLSVDSNGYLTRITNPAGESTLFNYTADGLLTSMTNPRNNIYRFSYDKTGRLIKDEDPAGGFKALERTFIAKGYSVKQSTGLNRNTTYQIESLPTGDQKRVIIFPDGLKKETIIGTNGSLSENRADGTRTMLVQGPDSRFGMLSPVTRSKTITSPGELTQTITGEHIAFLANPDDPLSLKNLTENFSINGRTLTNTYDAALRKTTSKTPMGRKIFTTLDSKGRVVESKVPDIVQVNFTYDSRGRLSNINQGTRTYTRNYDDRGNLKNITDPLSRSIGLEYDLAGRVTGQTLPDGRQIGYTYDANGNVVSVTPPGRPAHNFNFTPVDLMKDYLPPDIGAPGQTRYTYNIDRKLTGVTRPDGASIDLGYDNAGRLSTINYPQGITSLSYDLSTGNLKNITALGGNITYGYDGSLLTDMNWSGIILGAVHSNYDNNFRVISQSVNGNTVNFQYDLDGMLTNAGEMSLSRNPQNGMLTGSSLGNITDTFNYNSYGEITTYQADSSGSGIFAVNYTRDDLRRIVQKNETIDGITHTYDYTYDEAGRLTNVSKYGIQVSRYVYDANGNRLSYISPGGTISGTYDNQDRLLQYGTATYTYTANGELQSKTKGGQNTTYQYDAMGNLRNVTLSDGTKIEYVIDGQNRRTGKKVNGTLVQGFLYKDQLGPVAELDGAGNVVSRFVYAGRSNVPEYMVNDNTIYRIVKDHLGSPRMVITVTTGAVMQRMDYNEFGNMVLDSNPEFQPFGFAGGLYDYDTKLVRFGVRDYDAETGRWTTKDPIGFDGGDTNLYGYVRDDPVNRMDSHGLWSGFGACVGGIVGVLTGGSAIAIAVGIIAGGLQESDFDGYGYSGPPYCAGDSGHDPRLCGDDDSPSGPYGSGPYPSSSGPIPSDSFPDYNSPDDFPPLITVN